MSKKAVRIVVDIVMFISMCFLAGTGLFIHYRLVPGSRDGHGMLPLLAHSRRAFLIVKLINLLVGLAIGTLLMATGH